MKSEEFAAWLSAISGMSEGQRAEAMALGAIADRSHHRNDLLDGRRVGRVLLALVARRAASELARHGRRRAMVTCGVQQHGFHESSSWMG